MTVSTIKQSSRLLVKTNFWDTVISTPMDFQTMLKRVKSRAYKSKREFQDDLDLIWSNCLTYNAAPVCHSSYACCVYR